MLKETCVFVCLHQNEGLSRNTENKLTIFKSNCKCSCIIKPGSFCCEVKKCKVPRTDVLQKYLYQVGL